MTGLSKARLITTLGLAGILGLAGAGMFAKSIWDKGTADQEKTAGHMWLYEQLQKEMAQLNLYPRTAEEIADVSAKRVYLANRLAEESKNPEVSGTLCEMSKLYARSNRGGFTGMGFVDTTLLILMILFY